MQSLRDRDNLPSMTATPPPPPIQNYRPAQQPTPSVSPIVIVLAIVSGVSILCNVLLLVLWLGSSPAKVVVEERDVPAEPASQVETKPKKNVNQLIKRQNDEIVRHLILESSSEENRRIYGTVVNNGKKTGYIFVHFNLYDETGTKINTTSAHIQNLDAGERWNFKTTASDFASFKFSHFTAQPPQ